LWRPWYYAHEGKKKDRMIKCLDEEWNKDKQNYDFTNDELYQQFAVCDVAKQNEGPVGPVVLRFVDKFARFEPEDPTRPLFSNRPEERQQVKPLDKKKKPEPAPATNGHITEEDIKEVFPNATAIEP
jgi:hypothetical protein